MVVPTCLWDSSVIFSYLSGDAIMQPACGLIIEQAERGEIEIRVSTITQTEVAFLPGYSNKESENIVLEFFSRSYIVTHLCDIEVARIARRLISKYRPGFRPFDAIHMATALLWHIPILETTDPHLLKHNEEEGNPPLVIRRP